MDWAVALLVWILAAGLGAVLFALGAALGHRRGYEQGQAEAVRDRPPAEIVLADLAELARMSRE